MSENNTTATAQFNKPQDPMIKFKSTKKVVSKKGAEGLQLSMGQEEVVRLIDSLKALVANERGVKLSVYVSKKTTEDGREFDSGVAFISAIQEFGSYTKPTSTFKAKAAPSTVSEETARRIAQIKSEMK